MILVVTKKGELAYVYGNTSYPVCMKVKNSFIYFETKQKI